MLILTILLSLALAALFTLLPARIHHRRPACADLYAGAGVSALVWLWAVCVWSKPGLSVGFDAFRLAAIVIMQAIACGAVCGFRLRGTLPRKLRTPAAVGLLLAASLGIELFVCNLNWLATHSYTPVDLRPYLVNDADPAAPLTLNDEQTTLEFAGLDFAIYNLQLDGLTSLADGDTPEQKNVLLTLNVAATDEASSVSRQSWNWEAAPASARSQTHSLDLSGKASTLTLTASGYTGEYRSYPLNAQLTTVYANARRPLDFSVLRFAVIFALALAAFALRPASAAWQDAYLTHEKKYRPAVLAVGLALCAAAFLAPFGDRFNAGVATSFYNTPDWSGTSRIDFTMHINDWASNAGAQYGALAHSLLNGRLDLEKDPPAAMAELENPYDTAARQAAAPDALWDVAYYNGRYYVYFGIVPCLLFQLPFEALTGIRDLPPALPMILLAWLYILAVFGFVKQAARRWFPQASAATYLLTAAGADRVLTMDLHASQIQGFFDIPVDNLAGNPIFVDYYAKKYGSECENMMVVSPDVGSVSRARAFAQKLHMNLAIVDKRRQKANSCEVMNVIGDVRDKDCILFDDMVDTGGSLCNAAKALIEVGGAKSVQACASHGVLSGPAIDRINDSVITELALLDTIPAIDPKKSSKIKYLQVAPMFAEAIERIYQEISISKLFR